MENKFLYHYKKNQFWLWTAIETYFIAIVFIIQANFFDLKPPGHSVVTKLDDPSAIFGIAVVGTFALVYAVWDIHWFYARPLMIGLLIFVWMTFFLGFVIHDLERGMLISPGAILAGGVICRIISYAFTGDD
ncbi:hypothetical protein [Lentilactobacillus parabuchneri]|uniref:hypothetical protein n=1 Tax=Lentilactobacillus parabuchneri TaxID=152331 RepID=UPI002307448E|nr:hypothetical protein [Lentilactobacillus parabuchneri]MDB1102807.1 hypothetical protein [Lentilactobacillus parabuchneri]